MNRLFRLENPVWKFIGNLADFFLLSVLWLVCSLPVVTVGAATTALFYVALKMADDREGGLFRSYFASFRQNFKQATAIWLGFALVGVLIVFDLWWGMRSGTVFGTALFFAFAVVAVLYLLCLSFVFVLLARCENTAWAIVKMACAMVIRNLLPVFSGAVVLAAFVGVGLFVFWPVLLVTPGLCAYLNAFLYRRILQKYKLELPD